MEGEDLLAQLLEPRVFQGLDHPWLSDQDDLHQPPLVIFEIAQDVQFIELLDGEVLHLIQHQQDDLVAR